ncbi:hypothetical protein GGH91_003850 [Coemansia sp. RSA 2671]|uniref:Uncharacterized protein n=1 Tax=Coemansia linderi TaxID=2663919 RepID=A0ACC1KJL7_9FUNG|nr:hypothetical protein GGH91_003850 [Coemansia sp. RSA 2671]KAJ2414603.1 hypothetical protein GGI10_002272 [Coemansia sp. RSA 2530]KAJ2790922.1 hypothetical protein GGI18_001492 [Coemansia linderi]
MSAVASESPVAAAVGSKKTRGGRKGKAAWRKNIDLTDVEEGLEEKREEERQGGVVEGRKDQDIFMTDVVGDQKTKQKLQQTKKLRVDEILGKRSGVAIPTHGSKMGEDRIKRKEHHEMRKRLKKIAGFVGKERVAAEGIKAKPTTGKYDLWTETPSEIMPSVSQRRAVVSRKKLVHIAELPAVEVAHPGASYRPDSKDHQELIQKAGEEYEELTRKREKFSEFAGFRGNDTMGSAMECAQVMIDEIKAGQSVVAEKTEMGRDGSAEDSDAEMDAAAAESGDSDDDEQAMTTTSKDPKRKSRVTRNRIRRHNDRLVEEQKAKALVQQSRQLDQAKRLNKVVDGMVEKSEQAAERTRKHAEEKARQPRKKIGKNVVPQLLQAVKLAEDLPSSLRQLQPESNGFSEVYSSLVKRNFIEPRPSAPQKRQRRRVRVVEKWSYKDFK